MRFFNFIIGLLAFLTPLAAAWSKEDREIFNVRDQIISSEGTDVNFYEILGIAPNAKLDDINKAYKKKSRSLHPDKVRQQLIAERRAQAKADAKASGNDKPVAAKPPRESEIRAAQKVASEKQIRLGLIANILRGPERDRYDHFLANGFPVWKGTNYYYNRYRPGLGTVMVGFFIVVGGGFHYLALYMGWKRQREFVERYIKFARQTAWGENLGLPTGAAAAAASRAYTPPNDEGGEEDEEYQPRNRRERRMQQRENRKDQGKKAPKKKKSGTSTPSGQEPAGAGPTGNRKRVVAENGKVLVVDSLGDVYLEEGDEDGNVQMFLLDPMELRKPTFKDTAIVRFPAFVFRSILGRVRPSKPESTEPQATEVVEDFDDDSEPAQPTPSSGSDDGDFEMLDKSTESLDKAKTTGSQAQSGGRKRRGKKK